MLEWRKTIFERLNVINAEGAKDRIAALNPGGNGQGAVLGTGGMLFGNMKIKRVLVNDV